MQIRKPRQGSIGSSVFVILGFCCFLIEQAHSQDLEPRRWTPLPVGTSILGAAYAKTSGDIAFDPLLLIEDGKAELDTLVMSYSHFFALGRKLARFDALVPWQHANYRGLLDGTPDGVTRADFTDPVFRFSVHLLGAPDAGAGESSKGATKKRVSTVVGAAVAVRVPLGEYIDEELINLGQNRFVVRPQIGMVHSRGPWSFELTASTFFYTENDSFLGDKRRRQAPTHAIQSHVVRVFRPGFWASVSAAYGWGGENTVDTAAKGDTRRDVLAAVSIGFPVARNQGVKFSYSSLRKHTDAGADLDTLGMGWILRF